MSYGTAAALQQAVFERLSALVDVPVHDAVPDGLSGTWVLIGPETVRDRSDTSGFGAEHQMVLSVISDAEGFLEAKRVAAAISDGLELPLVMARGRAVGMWFDRAVARRIGAGRTRRIDLTFRVRVEG